MRPFAAIRRAPLLRNTRPRTPTQLTQPTHSPRATFTHYKGTARARTLPISHGQIGAHLSKLSQDQLEMMDPERIKAPLKTPAHLLREGEAEGETEREKERERQRER